MEEIKLIDEKNYIVDTYDIKDIIKFIESAGFSITNTNDLNNIEIRYIQNNELLQRVSCNNDYMFIDSNGNIIEFSDRFVKIKFASGIYISKLIRNEKNKRVRNSYNIGYGTENLLSITSEFEIFDFIGKITTRLNSDYLHIKQMSLETKFYSNDSCENISVEMCSKQLYFKYIIDFLNRKQFFSKYSKFGEAFRIILVSVLEDIDNIFDIYYKSIDDSIKELEESKKISSQEHFNRCIEIDKNIAKLKNVAKRKQLIK